jgi:hypothetical protein
MKKYAVLIGNGKFPYEPDKKTWADLHCPKNDIEGLAKLLINPEKGEFLPENVHVLLDKTSEEIIKAIYEVFHKVTMDDLILIYYSGHGVQVGRSPATLYLAAHNTVFNDAFLTAVPIARLRELMNIKVSHKKIILILDCCYSGDAGQQFACKGGNRDAELAKQLAEDAKGIYLLAAAGSTVALEREHYSLFTKYLIEALETGDADTKPDGFIDIHQLFNYIRPRVEKEEPKQQPRFYGIAETGGRLIISKSGRDSRKDRAEKIRLLLLDFEKQHEDIAEIKTEALAIARTEIAKFSPVQLQKDQLLTDLLDKKISFLTFDRAWNKTASSSMDWQSLRHWMMNLLNTTLIIVPVVILAALKVNWQPEQNPKQQKPELVISTLTVKPTPEQQLEKAQVWLNGDDVKKYSLAVELLHPLVKAGNTKAINLLANSYFFGLGVTKDEKHGCQLFKQAIEANNADEKEFYDKRCPKS